MVATKLIVAGVGGSGLAVSVGAGSYFYLTSDYTIEQLLRKEDPKKEVLNKETKNRDQWLAKGTEYVKTNKNENTLKPKDIGELEKWSEIGAKENVLPEAFIAKCENKLNDKVSNAKDSKYTEFLKFCTK